MTTGHWPDVTSGALSDEAVRPPWPEHLARATVQPASSDQAGAFRRLYDENAAFVWRNLRRLGVRPADVEDGMQEVFVVAHRRLAEFREQGHGPRAWLFQIALRVASDARRHDRRQRTSPDGGEALSRASVPAQQADTLERREELSRLDDALATIDLGRRAVLVLHEIEEMTAPEIARLLDIPLNTVYSRLRVAREELERALSATSTQEGER